MHHGSNVARLIGNDDIRLARWAGQSDDGKKHSELRPEGDPAFPLRGLLTFGADLSIELSMRLCRF